MAFKSRKIKDINQTKKYFGKADISFFANESKEGIECKIKKKNLHPDFISISDIKSGDSNITAMHFWFLQARGFVLEVKEHRNSQIEKHFGYTDKLYKREQ